MSKGFEFKPFSVKQQKLIHWWRKGSPVCDLKIVIADGAIRSGKTIACICSFLTWSMSSFQGENFILAGKTIGSLKKNVIGPMQQILSAWGIPYHYVHSGENYIEIGSNTYYLYDANNESSQNRLQGLTAAGALADEAALFPQNFVHQMIGRCSVEKSKIYLNCNPENPAHYIKQELIDKAEEKGVLRFHFRMEDNLSLSQETIDTYRRMFSGVFYRRFILGEWAQTDGLIYPQFANDNEKFLLDTAPSIQYATIGIDFGGTGSGHAFTLTGFTKGFHQVIVLDELYHNNKKEGVWSPKQLDEAFTDFVRRAKSRYRVYEAYCDSAEQTLIQGLKIAAAREHLGIEVKNAIKGLINNRIAFYNSLMAQERFFILRHCTAHIKAFSDAIYDPKKPMDDIRLDNGTTDIDTLDSTEYSTESVQKEILYLRG